MLNRFVLAGNLGRDPESRDVGDSSVCGFSIPLTTTRRGEKTTAWLQVSAWGRLGELCQEHLAKGSAVVVDGQLQLREYEKDGETKQAWEIRADAVHFAGPKVERAAPADDDNDPIDW